MTLRRLLSVHVCNKFSTFGIKRNDCEVTKIEPFSARYLLNKVDLHTYKGNNRVFRSNYICFRNLVNSQQNNPNTNADSTAKEKLAQELECNTIEAEKLINEHPKYFATDFQSVLEKIVLSRKYLPPTLIKENLWLLSLSWEELRSRFISLKHCNLTNDEIVSLLPVFKLNSINFQKLTSKFYAENTTLPEKNRIFYLAKQLQCSPTIIAEGMTVYVELIVRNMIQLDNILKTYKEFGITNEEIINEISSLLYPPIKARNRFERALRCGYTPISLSLTDYSEVRFQKRLEEHQKQQESLKKMNNSIEKYFAKQFGVTSSQVEELKVLYPKVFKTNPTKIKNITEFLISSGYTSSEIVKSIYIFMPSDVTIKERYSELQAYGYRPKLSDLFAGKNIYMEKVDLLAKELKSKQQDCTLPKTNVV